MNPDQLAALHAAAFGSIRAWSEDEFARLLAQKGVLCCGSGRCFVLARVIADEAEILTLATDPAHRRNGLAHEALCTAEQACAKAGATHIFLEVAEDNIAGRGLYKRAGYTQVGRRPGYYLPKDGAPIAALVLRKNLTSP